MDHFHSHSIGASSSTGPSFELSHHEQEAIKIIDQCEQSESENKALHLSYKGLNRIPEALQQLKQKQLKILHIDGNNITTVPDWIGELEDLEHLYIHNNDIEELPEAIGKLKKLETIDARGNKLSKLPETIRELKNIRWLNLDENQLTSLAGVEALEKLQYLSATHNKIDSLPYAINNLKELLVLDVGNNKLQKPESIPASIKDLPADCEVTLHPTDSSSHSGELSDNELSDEPVSTSDEVIEKVNIWLQKSK